MILCRIKFLSFFCLLLSFNTWSSKPKYEKAADCQIQALDFLRDGFRREEAPSARTAIPLSVLLLSQKDPYIAYVWRRASMYSKKYPSEGLAQMYATADQAVVDLVKTLKIKPVMAPARKNPWTAAAETLALMESKNAPEYIRRATLIRDGIVMVVPLLKKTGEHNGRTTYAPIVAKGHQELAEHDVLTAAFSAWALEPWQGVLPKNAWVYLKPMATKRSANPEHRGQFQITTEDFLPQIHQIRENFMARAEEASRDPQILETATPEKRSSPRNAWAPFYRTKLAEADSLSMMPFPPTHAQMEGLARVGKSTMADLAKVQVDSAEFVELSLKAGIRPDRLRYFIAHAIAKTQDQIIVMNPYQNPFAGKSRLVHIDFEDVLDPNIRSGVYLFGVRIEPKNGKSIKEFVWAEDRLNQQTVDDAWARFLRLLKTHPQIAGKDHAITIYSKHEIVKVEQEFDVLKQEAALFSKADRASPFYSEVIQGNKTIGRLIRNQEFFKKYQDIKPRDVFKLMDESIDLLDFVRKNLAAPRWSNSIKQILEYAEKKEAGATYESGMNGLESIAWAMKYYQTGERALRDKIQHYNGIDIFANEAVKDLVARFSGQPEHPHLVVTPELQQRFTRLNDVVDARTKVDALLEKKDLLERILGKPLADLSEAHVSELQKIFDRSGYLQRRRILRSNRRTSADTLESMLQAEKFDDRTSRSTELNKIARRLNPAFRVEPTNAAHQALGELLSKPTGYIGEHTIEEILVLSDVAAKLPRRPLKPTTVDELLNPPESWSVQFWKEILERPASSSLLKVILDGLHAREF